MTQILTFISTYMGFLWKGARYRIVDSIVSTSNGGDALVVIESDYLRIRIVRDRGQLFLDLQAVFETSTLEWYSIDLVRRLILGSHENSSILNESFASFMRDHLSEIEHRFSAEEWPETKSALKKLAAKRAKEMFG